MKRILLLFILPFVLQEKIVRADTVITVPPSSAVQSNTSADHSRVYQVNTASANGWPGWYINSIKIDSLVAYSMGGYAPSSDTFTLKIYNSSLNQIGSDYSATAVSGFFANPPLAGYNNYRGFSVTFALPNNDVQVAGSSSFYYSVRANSGTPFMWTGPSNSNYGAGWGTGNALAIIDGNTFSLGASTTALTLDVTQVPEPSALSLLTIGLGGVMALRRVRRKAD